VSALNVTSAPPSGGTAITITGSGFTAASGVALTGISRAPLPLLDVVVVNDTTVTATLPALGSGVLSDIGAVVVTGPGGSSSDALSFADTVRYVPTVTALSASSGPVSGGGVVAISGAGLSDTTAVDFGASAASYVDVVSDGEVIVLVPPSGASGTVDVTVHAEGVSATSPADQYTYSTLSGSGSIVAPSSPPAVGSTSGTNTSTDPGAAATSGAQSPAVGAPVTPTSSSPAVAPPPTVPTAAEGHAARYAGRPCLLLSKSELAAFGVAAQCARAATVTNGTTKISRATWGRVGPATPAISVTVWYVGGADPGATIRSLRSMYAAQGTVRLGRSVREQLPAAAGGRAAAEIVIGRYFCVVQESGTNRSVAQSIRAIGRASRSIAAAL
jgi:hypothetical protein